MSTDLQLLEKSYRIKWFKLDHHYIAIPLEQKELLEYFNDNVPKWVKIIKSFPN